MEKKMGGRVLELISGGMEVDFVVVFDLRPGNTKNVSLSVLFTSLPQLRWLEWLCKNDAKLNQLTPTTPARTAKNDLLACKKSHFTSQGCSCTAIVAPLGNL